MAKEEDIENGWRVEHVERIGAEWRMKIRTKGGCHIQFVYTNLARHLGCTSGWKDGRPSTSGAAGSWLSHYHCVPTRTKILSPPTSFSFSLPLSLSFSFSLPFSRLSSLPRPILFQPSTPLSASYTNFSPRRLCNVRVHRQFNFFVICVWTKEFAWKLPGKWFLQEIVELNAV